MVEVGKGEVLIRIIPLVVALLVIGFATNAAVYHGLNDAQSMDNAQLARQIVRGKGFTTEFLRPHAVAQLRDYAVSQSLQTGKPRDLFPSDQFPPGTPRTLPDTYNAPGYPYLLAAWFYIVRPEFEQTSASQTTTRIYSGDRWIPALNQLFLVLTAFLVFALGHRLFDSRVAWMSVVVFLSTNLAWDYTLTALSTTVLMFLVTAMLICTLEIFCVGEACAANEDRSFAPAWFWAITAGLLLAAASLTRLHLMVLLVPLFVLLLWMPRPSFLLVVAIILIVGGLVTPWFFHVNAVSGNPLGSNMPLMLYGVDDYTGNQIYCGTTIPSYERVFKDLIKKESTGFLWHFEHAWGLLGANPLILLFGASILHQFKRLRTRLFHWLLFACAFALVAANNLGSATPDNLDAWNVVVLLLPSMVVIGCAFFFILLDRMNLQVHLLNSLIVTATLLLTATPLVINLTTPSPSYSFPPYLPPVIKAYGQFAQTDEWITSDMPWATAWYADRASLWLPDSIADFENFHDNVCPTGILLLTPVTWSQPVANVTTGEYKDWFPLVVGAAVPSEFPLSVHVTPVLLSTYYSVWSDRPRWQTK